MLPEQDGRDDISISRLDQVSDGKGPLTDLASLELKLIGQVDNDGFERVLGWDLQLDLNGDLLVLVISRDYLLRRLVQHEAELVLLTQFDLGQLDLLDLVLHDRWADDLLDVGLGDGKELLVAGVVEFAGKGWEALHEVDQSVQGHEAARPLLAQSRAILGLEFGQVSIVVLLGSDRLVDDRQEGHERDEKHLVDRRVGF